MESAEATAAGTPAGTAGTETGVSLTGQKEEDTDLDASHREGHTEKTVKAGAPTAKTAMKDEGSSVRGKKGETTGDLQAKGISEGPEGTPLQQEKAEDPEPLQEGTPEYRMQLLRASTG